MDNRESPSASCNCNGFPIRHCDRQGQRALFNRIGPVLQITGGAVADAIGNRPSRAKNHPCIFYSVSVKIQSKPAGL